MLDEDRNRLLTRHKAWRIVLLILPAVAVTSSYRILSLGLQLDLPLVPVVDPWLVIARKSSVNEPDLGQLQSS